MAGHHMEAVTTMIVSGPLCGDAADCRRLAGALFGEELQAGDAAGLRIGVIRDEPSEDVDPEVREACESATEALRAETAGTVVEVELPDLAMSSLAGVLIANTEAMSGLTPQRLNSLSAEISVVNRAVMKYRMLLPAAASIQAQRLRALMRRRLAALFTEVDVLAWPTVPAPAPPLEAPVVELPSGAHGADQANIRGGALANLTGTPAINVPVGLSAERRLPIGLQLEAAWGRDALLLDAAEALERANGRRWVDEWPQAAKAEPAAADSA
jgi:aspartyl-tRNA(Asn)/glutamyl-tRNA(Gln) amidotransferase subunit A